jgi:Na+/H+ antiporter NhaD/arsenite permease-like protein
VHALRKADVPSVLFFLGILVAIAALESTHLLANLATYMDSTIGNINVIVISIGLLSAIIDNVPLVAATMGMYDMQTYPTDHYFWEFIAYCAGTGGSCLIIGSAAGVAAMGMEKIDFFWYVKKISLLALLGYFAGAFVYMAQHYFLHS